MDKIMLINNTSKRYRLLINMKNIIISFFKNKQYLITILFFELLIIGGLTYPYYQEKQAYSRELTDKLQTVVQAVINIYGIVSDTIYQEVINQPAVIDLFKQAYTADETERAVIRQQIQEKLQPTYDNLRQRNLRQLHFHLPDGTSFLRMHKPEKFGDKLFDVRYSVKLANTLKKPVQGFEEGRILNGFRYVFPLFDGETHIGSVETSVSFEAIHQEIAKLYPLIYQLILKKEIVLKKVFSDQQTYYVPCLISKDYLCENAELRKIEECEFCETIMQQIDNQLKNKISTKLTDNKPFVTVTRLAGINYVLTFYPIKNIQQQTVAYVVSYSENDHFVKLRHKLYLEILLFSLLNLLIFLFIFHIQHSKEVIERKNQALVKLNHEKNEFLGIAAHDLKNPLSAIKGLSEEIEADFDILSKKDVLEITKMITLSACRMFALISNLLDVSAIESGKFNLQFAKVDLLLLVQRIIETYQTPAATKGIQIHFNVKEAIAGQYVTDTDKNMAYQILDNLISNAVKYSPWHQSIYITLQMEAGFIRCAIKDEGPGLSQTDQEKLFGKFTRLTSRPTNGEHSTGLGLFIVKKLVEIINAQVWCESKLGQGATFIVRFPSLTEYEGFADK
jgi:signal transduction histidine kinase